MLLSKAKEKFLRHLQGLDRSWETVRGYRYILNYLEEFFTEKYNGPVYLDDIAVHELDEFIYSMGTERDWKPNSVKKCHYALSSFFAYCSRKELYQKDISKNMEPVRGERKERTYLTAEECLRLAGAIEHPIIRPIVYTMYYSGMRVTETLNLQLKDVDFKQELFYVRSGKGKVNRAIPMHQNLKPLLTEYLEQVRPQVQSQQFFATKKTGRVSAQYVNNNMKEACLKLGWPQEVTSHIMRHSFASNLVKKNTNLVHVQKLLGHADLRTTSVYTHVKLDELTDSINLL